MDKIQTYYTIMVALVVLGNLINVAKTMKEDSGLKASFVLFFTVLMGFPVAGRIYGWW